MHGVSYACRDDLCLDIMESEDLCNSVDDLGLLPAMVLAVIIAPLVGELPWPTIEMGFTHPHFIEVFTQWSPFAERIGFPGMTS